MERRNSDQQVIHQRATPFDEYLGQFLRTGYYHPVMASLSRTRRCTFRQNGTKTGTGSMAECRFSPKEAGSRHKDTDVPPQAALRANSGLDVILRDQNSMLELATYFQRGLHSGLDVISDP